MVSVTLYGLRLLCYVMLLNVTSLLYSLSSLTAVTPLCRCRSQVPCNLTICSPPPFQSAKFQSVIFSSANSTPYEFVRHFPVLQIQIQLSLPKHGHEDTRRSETFRIWSRQDKIEKTLLSNLRSNFVYCPVCW